MFGFLEAFNPIAIRAQQLIARFAGQHSAVDASGTDGLVLLNASTIDVVYLQAPIVRAATFPAA